MTPTAPTPPADWSGPEQGQRPSAGGRSMRAGHWVALVAIAAAVLVAERAGDKLEHAIIIASYYEGVAGKTQNRLALESVFPFRYSGGHDSPN